MKGILVTGATGQIGSELTIELREKYGKNNVIAVGHRREPSEKLLASGPFEYLDVTKRNDLEKAVKKYDVGIMYHLAAVLSAVGEKDPQLTWHVNIDGLYNVLEVARVYSISKIFWPSSVAVFGRGAPRVNTPQETVLMPSTMYGVTKVGGEALCNYYFQRFGLDVRSVRYPGIVSSETPPGGGTTDYAVEIFYEAIKRKRYICFLREDATLPMMYMPDCIKAAIDVMEADLSGLNHRESYNLAAMSFSPMELAAEISKYMPGFQCEYKPDFRQKIADSWPMSIDDSMARTEWAWKPDYDLTSMTEDMLQKLRVHGTDLAEERVE